MIESGKEINMSFIQMNSSDFNNLSEFVTHWNLLYREQLQDIPLFNTALTSKWPLATKQQFVKIFYHLRGHFDKFLWLMGNFAPDFETKQIILKNIAEEFGETRRSHEQLYFDFANALAIDLKEEIITEDDYLPFAREFNHGHLVWLLKHSWNEKQAAFSAYESLDNVDYPYLLAVAESFGLAKEALIFFRAHIHVQHYEATQAVLQKIWQDDRQSITLGFDYIYNHQLTMWHNFSTKLFSTLTYNAKQRYPLYAEVGHKE
jgi:pyrroloquinoline quinone (PQQ) biosynthesis protein C